MRTNSAVVIARLLNSEGFSDHVGNMVEKYWMRNICKGHTKKKHRKLDKEIGNICLKLTDAEKLILGKFISLHKRMSFDTGLRIGLTAFARKNDKEYCLMDSTSAMPAVTEMSHDENKCLRDLADLWQAIKGDSPAEKCMRDCGCALESVLEMHTKK